MSLAQPSLRITPVQQRDRLPLSLAQQRLRFLAQMEGVSKAYHVPLSMRLAGELNPGALRWALDRVVARHEALRTTFVLIDGEPVQKIAPAGTSCFHLVEHDLSAHPDAEGALRLLVEQEASAAFDLSAGPLIRGRLIRLCANEHALLMTAHHIVCDGWSIGVLTRELNVLYGAFLCGEADPLLPLPVQYADYAVWQRSRFDDGILQRQAEYWKATLAAAPALLDLPGDHPRPARQDYAGAFLPLVLNAPLTAALKVFNKRHGSTLYMTLLAAWAVLLARLSGQQDIVIGTPVAGRSRAEIEELIGFFVNTLALRLDLSGSPSVGQLLQQVKARVLAAQQHQDVPFEQVVEMMRPMRSLAHSPLFQVMFVWQNTLQEPLALAGLTRKPLEPSSRRVIQFDLRLSLREAEGTIRGGLEYATSLFEPSTIERYLGHFQTLLEAMVSDDTQQVDTLALLTNKEREQLLYEWNDTSVEFPSDRCVHELFEQQAGESSDAVAVVYEGRELTYAELNRSANRLAHHLRALGVGPDARVAICMQRSLEMIVALLAVLKAGGAYVPLDPGYPAERLRFMLQDSAPIALLTQRPLQEALIGVNGTLPVLDIALDASLWNEQPHHNPDPTSFGLTSNHLAYVIYTSGSTGTPKGVAMPHRALINLLRWQMRESKPDRAQSTLQFGALGFDVAFQEIFSTLCVGGVLVLVAEEKKLDPAAVFRLIADRRIQRLFLPCVALQLFAEELANLERIGASKHCSLSEIITAGDQLRIEPKTARLLDYLAPCRLQNQYGPTESHVVTAFTLPADTRGWPLLPSIGRPIANTRIYILDALLQPVPIGVAGELYIGGVQVARGYLNQPQLTAERFFTDPFIADHGAQMYKTGDLARFLANGNIEYLGRSDFQIKIRGFRIEPGEIEARFLEYPGIREVVVTARDDTQGQKRLVAYYALADAESIDNGVFDAAGLRSHLSSILPEYMVPAAYVRLQVLPVSPNGKLDRQALPAPEADAYTPGGHEAPRGEMETALAALWAEVLKLEQVGRHDNFFEIGGHSLLAVRVITRLQQEYGAALPLIDLFAFPVLCDFARRVETAEESALSPIPRAARDRLPLSLAQQRLRFLAQMEGVSKAYHVPLSMRLAGELNPGALRWALDRVVARHEALRTTFVLIDGEPVQKIAPAGTSCFHLVEHDLSAHPDAEGALRLLVEQEASAAFDLSAGPLIRGRLIRLCANEHALLMTAHHIVCDGWSIGVLTRELNVLYGAFLCGEADPLLPLPVQYADYAVWQRSRFDDGILQRQAEYWKATLAAAPALLDLPGDHPRPARQDYAGAFLPLVLNAPLTAALKVFNKRHGSTLYMTLLAAWAVLLARLSGQQDIVIGTPVAGRSRAEIEELIGFFVNTLALRLDLSGSPSVGQLLQQVKARVLAAQQHQDVPFEQVVEMMRPMRSLAHSPLFQVMFVWQNTLQEPLALAGLTRKPLEPSSRRVIQFDLRLSLREAEGTIRGGLEYATSLFEPSTIERYLGHFQTLLEAMVSDDTQQVDTLALLTNKEREQLLYEWNDTSVEFPSDRCVHELFEQQAGESSDAVAVVYEGRELTYAELNRSANRLAHHLRALGVGPDARVAICMQRSLEMIVALLAVLKAGGAYVPLDPGYPAERLRFMLQDSAPIALLTQRPLQEALIGVNGTLPVLDIALDASLWNEQPHHNPDPTSFGLTSNHLAYVIYTSGSTGTPKGVAIEHGSLVNRLLWMVDTYAFNSQDTVLQKTPFSFDVSVWELFAPLIAGARLVMARPDGHKEPAYLIATIRQEKITTAHFVPSMLQSFIEYADPAACSSLVRVVCSGEVLTAKLVRRFHNRLPGVGLYNLYGPTETTVDVTAWTCFPNGQTGATIYSVPIGRPVANTRIYILDAFGEPAPIGVAGELFIGGVQVARGYLNKPELTLAHFVDDPFAGGQAARMYKTGDLGRWHRDKYIEFLGRNDVQIKIRGFRVEPGEIESKLVEHAEVREAVVTVREDTPGDQRLVAYYTVADTHAAEGPPVNAEALRSHLAALLPEHMVPAAYVPLSSLPLSPNGKLDRSGLPIPHADVYSVRNYQAPQGETETVLAALWAEVLKLERVGRNDNFFELGGHSLLAVTLVDRLSRLGFDLDVRALFLTPTLAQLAASVGGNLRTPLKVPANRIPSTCDGITPEMLPLVELTAEEIGRIEKAIPGGPANIQDIYPLAPLQEGILFHHLLDGTGDPYLLDCLFRFDSRTRLDNYLRALEAVIHRHDILRTAILWDGLSQPVQVVQRRAALPTAEITPDAANDVGHSLRECFSPRHNRINLRQAPLLRLYVAPDQEDGSWVLLMLLHHLVGDHTTLELMQQEIQLHLLGRADQLLMPLPFRNLVVQSRFGVSREEHAVYFRKLLLGIDEPTAPFGLLDVQGDGSEVMSGRLKLETTLAMRLRERARGLSVSVASLCHLAWAMLLARVSGREDVVFGTVLFGRMQAGAGSDRVMGPFINTLPVRIHIGAEGAEVSVRSVHAQLADLTVHEHASLALVQKCSAVPAPAPLFSALFNYRYSSPDPRHSSSVASLKAWEGIEWTYGEERTSYPFALSVDDYGHSFLLTAQVQRGIEAKRVCQFMHTALEHLVSALESAPTDAVRGLEVLPEVERHQLLYEWNYNADESPGDFCIHELFEQQVSRTPDAIALVYENWQLTYSELNRSANQLAHHLRKLGVKPDTCVAICVERSFAMVVASLAVLKAGGAYVPLDPAYPPERLRFMMEDSAPIALLTQSSLQELFSDVKATLVLLDLPTHSLQKDQPEHNPDRTSVGLTPRHLAYVIYTSGSTGMPKGVMVEHRSVCNLAAAQLHHLEVAPGSRVLQFASFSFDAFVFEVVLALLRGASLHLVSQGQILAGDTLVEVVVRNRITHLILPPAVLATLSLEAELPSLQLLMIAGEALPGSLANRWAAGRRLINAYGPTEATVWATLQDCNTQQSASVPIGRPLVNTRIYILDAAGRPAPAGVMGELCIGGTSVARGYLNRPELTAKRFLADPFSSGPNPRMYRTGDLGKWLASGTIEFLGRNDLQVKVRGYRIELEEIEACLKVHRQVRDGVVVAAEDTSGDRRLVAYYTVTQEGQPESLMAGVLRAHLAASLPQYMVPGAFVQLPQLPLTPNGKVDRKSLPAPQYTSASYRSARTPLEEILSTLFAEVLQQERVGIDDNFFTLGGTSLSIIRLTSRIHAALGARIPVHALFQAPTVALLGEYFNAITVDSILNNHREDVDAWL
jgi:amino acid adenylation domain-containing protein